MILPLSFTIYFICLPDNGFLSSSSYSDDMVMTSTSSSSFLSAASTLKNIPLIPFLSSISYSFYTLFSFYLYLFFSISYYLSFSFSFSFSIISSLLLLSVFGVGYTCLVCCTKSDKTTLLRTSLRTLSYSCSNKWKNCLLSLSYFYFNYPISDDDRDDDDDVSYGGDWIND